MASASGLRQLIESGAMQDLARIVAALAQAAPGPARVLSGGGTKAVELPSREAVAGIVESLRGVLFPGYFGGSSVSPDSTQFVIGAALDRVRRELKEQIQRGYCLDCPEAACTADCEQRAALVTAEFLAQLPAVQALLLNDAAAGFNGDPACISTDEAIFCYPYMLALTSHRLAHELHLRGVPLLPRMISEQAHSLTGIDIHPGASIGESFFIDHGTGVVIGETCVIGRRVKLYQGVTLGALSFPLDEQGHPVKGIPRHPIVEDDVTIYSGATVLGRVTIGAGSVIGGNVWLTRSVPPDSRVYQAQPRSTSFSHGAGI